MSDNIFNRDELLLLVETLDEVLDDARGMYEWMDGRTGYERRLTEMRNKIAYILGIAKRVAND